MSSALGYLFLILPVVAVAWIVWRYRRAAEDKEAQRREREAALVEMVKQRAAGAAVGSAALPATSNTPTVSPAIASAAPAVAPATAATTAFAAVAPVAAPVAAAAVTAAAGQASGSEARPATAPDVAVAPDDKPAGGDRRDRFLSHSETLVYFLLRAGIPGHEVFPRASLASVIAHPPPATGSTAGAASSTYELDFVVCDRRMRIVAAVQVEGRLAPTERARVEQSLAAAGIKVVTVDLKGLPKKEELSALVLGPAG